MNISYDLICHWTGNKKRNSMKQKIAMTPAFKTKFRNSVNMLKNPTSNYEGRSESVMRNVKI